MNNEQLNRFKSLLSVPSKSRDESRMVNYLCDYLDDLVINGENIDYYVDHMDNIYVTKGVSEYYPCYVAHTDTVHSIDSINVIEVTRKKPNTFGKTFGDEEFLSLTAVNDDGNPTGIGGDDKAGIFTCLEIMNRLDECKLAFFVSEEIGCIGSSEADVEFFQDVTYVCQYDAPGDHLITEICSGVRLFENGGDFITMMEPIIEESFGNPMLRQSHPYTDVMQLKNKLPISCINISCGYYNMHTSNEFIVLDDVVRAIDAGVNMAKHAYGYKHYFENEVIEYKNDFEVDVYEKEECVWLSDECVVFNEEEGMVIEEYGTRNYVSLTERECKKLYQLLVEKYEGKNQLKLF
jgi:di/tripeptidase